MVNTHHFRLPSILSPFFAGDPNIPGVPLCFSDQVVGSRDKHVVLAGQSLRPPPCTVIGPDWTPC